MKDCILIRLCEHRSLYCYLPLLVITVVGIELERVGQGFLGLFLNYNGIDNFKELCVCFNFLNTFVNFINVSCTKKYMFSFSM